MSIRTPSPLEHLAMQSLLSNQSLLVSALKDLSMHLFPSVFMEAYDQGHTEVLKAMVQAWPFPCLPLGDLDESLDLETLNAVLDGLDLLLAKKERPSGWKLQVLNLQGENSNIWIKGYTSMALLSYPDISLPQPTGSCGLLMTEEQPLMIVMNLTINHGPQDAFQASLLQWARKRKKRVQLWCRKLQILSGSIYKIQKALLTVRLDSIRELKVNKFWLRETMKNFAPYLSQMKNLHIFNFSKMSAKFYTSTLKNAWYSCQYAAHLGQLQHLQELHVHSVFFLYGKLPNILQSVTHLKTLSLHSCPLKETDIRFVSLSPCTKQLKHLRLRSLFMGCFSPELLRALLEHVAGTVEMLALEDCAITNSHLSAILPALSQCSQLIFFSFYGNDISMAAMQNLLSHTARLGRLRLGLYPLPQEGYPSQYLGLGSIGPERIAQVWDQLIQALRDMRTTQKVQICPSFCHCHKKCLFYSLGPDGSWVLKIEPSPDLCALLV
ncbi:PRAME family member 12-like [Perognathus longimembris pacificus]|uniref:PRAME family member 12-like n=1 Tax=Perognathus longimembris pacificus TaxID=214514 RepID=UPI002019196E|nr:PRAME family member 12-like [Perognathus longimembris pacificus]